jgi:signal transduction histidine kinase
LGLHISYNIVQKHRGKIDVDSKPSGTRFVVTLPKRLRK